MLEKPKLRTYIKHKKKLEMEKYLNNNDFKGRRMLSRIRSGTNNLRIETGRYDKLKIEDRICKICNDGIEDEEHFLHTCTAYIDLRKECTKNLNTLGNIDNIKKIMFGGGNEEQNRIVIRYIRRAMARRWRILEYIW